MTSVSSILSSFGFTIFSIKVQRHSPWRSSAFNSGTKIEFSFDDLRWYFIDKTYFSRNYGEPLDCYCKYSLERTWDFQTDVILVSWNRKRHNRLRTCRFASIREEVHRVRCSWSPAFQAPSNSEFPSIRFEKKSLVDSLFYKIQNRTISFELVELPRWGCCPVWRRDAPNSANGWNPIRRRFGREPTHRVASRADPVLCKFSLPLRISPFHKIVSKFQRKFREPEICNSFDHWNSN